LTQETLDDLSMAPVELKQRVFKAHVSRVEIETHAKCNRICSFCPNVIMDRRRNKAVADADMLDRVFQELGSIGYARQIIVARYSEPLANRPELLARLTSARALAPQATLGITTNTDYLNPDVLHELRQAGLNIIYMSIYLKDKERWSAELAQAYSERLSKKLQAEMLTKRVSPTVVECTYKYPGLRLSSTCHNWDQYGMDRGGSMPDYANQRRLGPCREPYETFVIDYDGSVMPCCALRSDLPQHRDFVVGDLSIPGTSVVDIYAGQLAAWRRSLVGFGVKGSPCTTCRQRDIPADLISPIAAKLEKHLHRIGHDHDFQPPFNRAVAVPALSS
jgi:MoaA/NifB/PqqE/SkfB family radical SAM enzyme